MRLQNKVAIVTGASRSIGAAIAKCYAAEGAKVVVNYCSNPELAHQVVDEIVKCGGAAFAYGADVSKENEVQAMVEETVQQYGTVDILVNNAAMDPRKAWYEITVEEWDYIMGINVKSQFLCAKAVFPLMKEKSYGKIINVSSVTFFTGQKHFLHYVTSKGAIVGFTRALARELGEHRITVNCITPGAVHTETEQEKEAPEALEKAIKFLAEAQSFSRRQVCADLIGAFIFFASSDSDFITGQTLNVDGGWMMH